MKCVNDVAIIMETAKGDSSMMSGMYNIMKDNPKIIQMTHNNTGNSMMNVMKLMRRMMMKKMQNKNGNGMKSGKQPMEGMKH